MGVDGPWEAAQPDQPAQPGKPTEPRRAFDRPPRNREEPPTDEPDTEASATWKETKPARIEPPTDEPRPETQAVEDSGPGTWGPVTESMSERAEKYQAQVTGAPPRIAYTVGRVKFDGYSQGVLQDAKGPGYEHFVKDGTFDSWFTGKAKIVDQATRQLRASNGYPITWYIAEEGTLEAITDLLDFERISGITLVHVPAVE